MLLTDAVLRDRVGMFKAQTCKLSAQGQVAGPAGLVATRGLCLMVFVSVQPLKTGGPFFTCWL